MLLTAFKALTFDCYGTLIDWGTGILAAFAPLAACAKSKPSREQILTAYAKHEHTQEEQTPHLKVLAVARRHIQTHR